jgi:hypothetical protein
MGLINHLATRREEGNHLAIADRVWMFVAGLADQELKVGQISGPRFSDRNAQTPRSEVKPFAKSAGNYSFRDISKVTHN